MALFKWSQPREWMKVLVKYLLIIGLFLTTTSYANTYEPVEFYNDPAVACCVPNPFMGLYLGANAGYSWFRFFLHRPAQDDLSPLLNPSRELKDWVPVLTLGYDLYPRRKIPLRIEINFTYSDDHFSSNPLYLDPLEQNFFAGDTFRIYNSMVSLYFDLHPCSRFVPYLGISGGYELLVTEHQPLNTLNPSVKTIFHNTAHGLSWGGTVGTRFFFSNHLVANFQLRFNNLKGPSFIDHTVITSPAVKAYSSDYFHETTLLIGLAYEF
jgi:opacity protein-like surface antigen